MLLEAIPGKRATGNKRKHIDCIGDSVMILLVNAPGYDDVGRVLAGMGQGFEYLPAKAFKGVSADDAVLFLNCGSKPPASARKIRKFILNGGTVYASDRQAKFICRVLPEVFRYSTYPQATTLGASVADQSLAEIIGAHIELEFDLPDWKFLIPKSQARDQVKVYLVARQKRSLLNLMAKKEIPLVLGYDHPQGGSLFFTAFHNHVQESEQEKELLRFLLFRPIMSKQLQQARSNVANVSAMTRREYTGGLRSGAAQKVFRVSQAGHWSATLSWSGQAKLALEFLDTTGYVTGCRESWTSPLELSGSIEAGGGIRIRYIDYVQQEIPFCLVTSMNEAQSNNAWEMDPSLPWRKTKSW